MSVKCSHLYDDDGGRISLRIVGSFMLEYVTSHTERYHFNVKNGLLLQLLFTLRREKKSSKLRNIVTVTQNTTLENHDKVVYLQPMEIVIFIFKFIFN
jgi:hypothetical protein